MNDAPPTPIAFSPVAAPGAPRVGALRLVAVVPAGDRSLAPPGSAAKSAPLLLASETYASPPLRTEIHVLPLPGGPFAVGSVASVPQLLPAPPRWDAATGANGALTFVLELAGGALNALFLGDGASGQRTSLTAHRPFASFSGPRFVRGGGGSVSAIVDNAAATVLSLAPDGTVVERPIGACDEVVVIGGAGAGAAVAVCKRAVAGASRGNVLPGAVALLTLGDDGRPVGAEAAPFGDRRVFELDADGAGEALVLVATGPGHFSVVHRPAPGAPFRSLPVDVGAHDPRTFSSPCVVVTGRAATFAVLSKARTDEAAVLVASWPLGASP